jgi:hypothetical protein
MYARWYTHSFFSLAKSSNVRIDIRRRCGKSSLGSEYSVARSNFAGKPLTRYTPGRFFFGQISNTNAYIFSAVDSMTDTLLQVVELDQRLDVEPPKQQGKEAIQTGPANRIEEILPASTHTLLKTTDATSTSQDNN